MGAKKVNKLLRNNKYYYKYKDSLASISSLNTPGYKTSEYNYLQNSIIPTYHFQKSLPKLPIPKLEDTCKRYLNALKPILNDAEYSRVEALAKKFETSDAVSLDKQLRDQDAAVKDSNYISEPWFDMYLSDRSSIVLNYNPCIAYVPHSRSELNDQTVRATNFLISSLRLLNSLRANNLEPEVFHINPEKSNTLLYKRLMRIMPESVSFYGSYMFNAYPLDMSQYFRLFNSTRIPKQNKDELFTDVTQKHILVIRKGHYFIFPVLDETGNILPPETLYSYMSHITSMNIQDAEHPIGVLTSENRNTWASIRESLEKSGNQETLKLIDSSIYCISLDDLSSDDPDKLIHNYLHGDPKNRWFDKSLSLIITKNAQAAVNFEHSWGDGVAVLRFFTEVFADTEKYQFVTTKTKASSSADFGNVRRLEFKLDSSLVQAIKVAQEKYNAAVARLKVKNFELDLFGKKFIKKFNVSPDSVMQTAFQTAFFQLHGQTVATYESCSTAAFKYGRTETIRPATLHTQKFSEAFTRDSKSNSELISLLRDCSKTHSQLTKEAAMGQGFDRHLFAMRYLANKTGQKLPDLYLDPAYKLINHNILSTSTLAHPTVQTGGFAPVVENGYGIGYRILDSTLGACITSYPSRNADEFTDCLVKVFEKFHKLFKEAKSD